MARSITNLQELIARAQAQPPIRVAVVAAGQGLVLDSVREAASLGLIAPRLIGNPDAIRAGAKKAGIAIDEAAIISASDAATAARTAVDLVRNGEADAVMKGNIHTDAFMQALLDKEHGLRVTGRRVSHVFLVDIATYPKLFAITDAAINIAPDLNAKAEILENSIALLHLLGVDVPKVAVLSAIETVNPAIVSTLDAACLSQMAKRGQIVGAIVDGPMAFDNAISADAAREKGIVSDVAGDVDILLVPDLVSGNILTKDLEYLAGATAAGVVVGLSVPVVLNSRADSAAARLAALALAVLMRPSSLSQQHEDHAQKSESAVHCAPQPEAACHPIGV